VTDESASQFDLSAWASETMPGLVEAEGAEDWCDALASRSSSPPHRPVSGLLAEDSPLSVFIRHPETPPEGLGRSERRAFYDDWRAAHDAALEAVEDAAEHHAQLVKANGSQKSANKIDALIFSHRGKQTDGAGGAKREPDQPPRVGRW
jgi:hypothetical protein